MTAADQDQDHDERGRPAARAFAGLNEAEKFAAVLCARLRRESGTGRLTDEQRGLLDRAGFGDVVAGDLERAALADPRFRELQALMAARGGEAAGAAPDDDAERLKVEVCAMIDARFRGAGG